MARGKPTQKDVADEAGVSQTLVSLVLNKAPMEVAEGTRNKILEAASKLGYISRKKKSDRMTGRKGKVFAYIRPFVRRDQHQEHWIYDAYDEFYDRIQNSLVEAVYRSGASLIVRPYQQATELTHWLIEWGVDGVFWHAFDEELLQWVSGRYPVVQINRNLMVEADSVSTNQEESVMLSMDYLYARGHERVAFLPNHPVKDNLWKLRTRAYFEHAERKKKPVFKEVALFEGAGQQDLMDLFFSLMKLPQENRPTAVIASDHISLRLMKQAIERGMSLPQDLSIIGIDNIAAGAATRPGLTSVNQRMDEVVRIAVELMLNRSEHPQSAYQKIFVTPTIVERASVTHFAITKKSSLSTLNQS